MACACKVNQQLSYLQRRYGTDSPDKKGTNISVKVEMFFKKVLNGIVVVVLSPIMLLSILLSGGTINMGKKFGLSKK